LVLVGIWFLRCANGYADSVALRAGEIEDDGLVLRVDLVLDSGESAEEQVAGVGHDGATAGSDSVGSEEFVEFAEDMVNVHRGMKLLDAADQRFREVAGVELLETNRSMPEAKAGFGIGGGHAATASAGSASGAVGRGGISLHEDDGFLVHESFLSGMSEGVPLQQEPECRMPAGAGMFQFGKKGCTPRQFS